MKITAIKQQEKQKDRYSIFIDDKFAFGLSELGLINSGLRVNQELDREAVGKLKEEAQIDKAYNRTLALLARRPRSEGELRDYLKRKNYDSPTADLILNKLSKVGLVDDRSFARMWVENRRLLKATSLRRLRQELRQKHIADEIVDEVLKDDKTAEREVLRELIERKRARYPDKLKFMQYLARQGYNYDDIKTVLDED